MADGREPRLFSTRSLYQLCVSAVVDRFRTYKPYIVDLPKSVRFDLYYQVMGRQAVAREHEGSELMTAVARSVSASRLVMTGTVSFAPRVPNDDDDDARPRASAFRVVESSESSARRI